MAARHSKNKNADAPRYSDSTGSKAAANVCVPIMPTARKPRTKSAVATRVPLRIERRLHRQQVAPREPLGGGCAQQVGGVQRRQRPYLPRAECRVAPLAAQAHDPVRGAEDLLGRDS